MLFGGVLLKKLKRIIVLSLALILGLSTFSFLGGCKKETSYTVKFLAGAEDVYYYDDDGNLLKVPEEGLIQTGITKPEDIKVPVFVRNEYNFVAWNNSLWEITSDKEFKAIWSMYTFTITYNGNGGLYKGRPTYQLKDITDGIDGYNRAPAFEKEGYNLSWDKTEQEFAVTTESCTVNAVWTPKTYTIAFKDIDGNDFDNNTMDVVFNNPVGSIKVEPPKVEGKRLAGWKDINGFCIDEGMNWGSNHGLEYYPIYTDADNYVISYDMQGATREKDKIYYFTKNSTELPVSNPFKTGYDFIGWKINDGDVIKRSDELTIDDAKINGELSDIKLTACWAPQQYYLSFDADGGIIDNQEPVKVVYDQEIGKLPVASKEGYVFVGWEYQEQVLNEGDISQFRENATLKAKYLYTYKIKFSLTTKTNVYVMVDGKKVKQLVNVECKLKNWGDVPRDNLKTIEEIEIEIIEGQSFATAIKNFSLMPLVAPLENPEDLNENTTMNLFMYAGYWKWHYSDTKGVYIRPDTVFTPTRFLDVPAGGTIVIAPVCVSVFA